VGAVLGTAKYGNQRLVNVGSQLMGRYCMKAEKGVKARPVRGAHREYSIQQV